MRNEVKEPKKKSATKKKQAKNKIVQYEYLVSFVDNNNKFGSMLVDMYYLINSSEAVKMFDVDMRKALNGNYRCVVNCMFLRKKFVKKEELDEGKTN